MKTLDTFSRPLQNLRISVTDRCNLRCRYCMPEEEYIWLKREELLNFEEISQLVDIFCSLGVRKVRLTGGEPLLRRDLFVLLRLLAQKPSLKDIALTTNGVFLKRDALLLKEAGLHRITISIDSLKPARFFALTKRDVLPKVLRGIEAAKQAGLSIKINMVVIKGVNEDEIVSLLSYGKQLGAEVRFIEYMDVGGATNWSWGRVFSQQEILNTICAHHGAVTPESNTDSSPATQYFLPDGTPFGIIASTTAPFCQSCDRSRLTADGMWYLCLYAKEGIDLRKALREKKSIKEIKQLIASSWKKRIAKGAEDRLLLKERGPLAPAKELQKNPHLEMHTRGG